MKLHRIFIAINLPEGVKQKLLSYRKMWPEGPARWITKENLHLTLAFLGNTSETELQALIELCKRIGETHKPFELTLHHIVYGPMPSWPRMIWALIEKSPELLMLQNDVEKALASSQKIRYQPEQRSYSPHLTLARFKMFELQKMELEELPDINEEISLVFRVSSIEIMESKLKRSGAEYTSVQSIPLTKPHVK